MKSGFILLTWMLLNVALCSGQDISGTWEGNYSKEFLSVQPKKLVVDLFLHHDSLLSGSSHLYYRNGDYEHYTVTGVYHSKDSSVVFSEDSTLGVKLTFSNNCLGNYTTRLRITDTSMRLEGRWKDNDRGLFSCPTTSVWLEKKRMKGVVKTEMPVPVKIPDKNLERAADIQSLIEIEQSEMDSIKIELVDNAQIDHDVVSVYINDSLVIQKQKINAEPVVFYVTLRRNEGICRIKMAAESMGSVPPCTALMIVTTNKKRYEVTLSSNFNNNGVLELFLKE